MLGGLLAFVVGLYALASYVDLRRVLMESEADRLRGVAELVARLANQTITARREVLARLAESRTASGAWGEAGVATLLDTLVARLDAEDRVMGLEVIRGERCVASAWRSAPGGPVRADIGCAPLERKLPIPRGDLPSVSPLLVDDSLTLYATWVTGPTEVVAEHRALAPDQTAALIASLVAPDAEIVIANTDGSVGTNTASMPADVFGVPGTSVFETAEGRRMVDGARVTTAPWGVWVHRDVGQVLAPARDALLNRLLLGLVVLLAGMLAAVAVSRTLTRPLTELTAAALELGRGRRDLRVSVERSDELGVLAASFNSMADQLEAQHGELEHRVAERTRELDETVQSLRETREELVRTERLAALGQLAGGVGHELRNPLGAMTNAVYCLRAALPERSQKTEQYLAVLERQIETSLKIVSSLLDYARGPRPEVHTVRPRALVEDAVARAPRPSGVEVLLLLPDDLPPVRVDPDHIGQVLLNLVTNAFQAMADEDRPRLEVRGSAADGEVRLDIVDNGPGIEHEHLERIFEPLFTTRSRGIGLGLSLSRSFVQANGGALRVRSEPGGGAHFELILPAAPLSAEDLAT